MTKEEFGRRLRKARKAQGFTMEQFAERTEISRIYLSEIEHGRKLPAMETFTRMVNALDVSADYLLKDDLKTGYLDLDSELYEELAQLPTKHRKIVIATLETLIKYLRDLPREPLE